MNEDCDRMDLPLAQAAMSPGLEQFPETSERQPLPVVIIGNGPSAICLSYFLSGHRPYVRKGAVHPNPILQRKLQDIAGSSVVEQDLEFLSEGLEGRSHNPLAVLFDALVRPDGDLGGMAESVLTWRLEPKHLIPHLVLGKGPLGGAWHLQKNAAKHHLAHKGVEGSKFWGGSQNASKEIERVAAPSYLHSSCKKVEEKCLYDRIFHVKEGYVPKLSRDDRAARLKLQVCEEEKCRGVPLLSSSIYGRRKPLEAPTQQHSRVEVIKDFYRNRGTNIPPWD